MTMMMMMKKEDLAEISTLADCLDAPLWLHVLVLSVVNSSIILTSKCQDNRPSSDRLAYTED